MDWKKVKNILIVLLLATNLILAAGIYGQFTARNRAERQAIHSALELVKDALSVSESIVNSLPREMFSIRVARGNELEDAFARSLLGGEATSEAGGGGIFRYEGKNGRGEIKRGGEIEFYLPLMPENNAANEYYAKLLRDAGLDVSRSTAVSEVDGGVSFDQYWEGRPILGYSLRCEAVDGATRVSGQWLISQTWARQDRTPARAELVIRLAGVLPEGEIHVIDSIICAYYVENTGGQDSIAVPVWLIETGGETLIFDLLSAQIVN